jgi:hypothetical protein
MKFSFQMDKVPSGMIVNMCDKQNKCRESNLLEGKYVNYFEVGHNAFEFVLDFGQSYVENQEPHLHTRIVTSPAYARAFLETLRESVEQYERSFTSSSSDC